jgi:hypothetical protein
MLTMKKGGARVFPEMELSCFDTGNVQRTAAEKLDFMEVL